MKTEFARDLADENLTVDQAATERPGKPIRVRIQPMVLRGTGQYTAWKDVRWTLDCDTRDETFAVREAMRLLFQMLTEAGPAQVVTVLTDIQLRAGGKEQVA
jgi:hypothetical protein